MAESLKDKKHLGAAPYIWLVLIIVFFSGLLKNVEYLRFLDFSTLVGNFGSIVAGDATFTFTGKGGAAAKDGFLFGVSLVPPAMLALGAIRIAEYYGALEAARRLLTPVLKPLLGIPGVAGLALIASLQNVDAGGGMTRELYDKGEITDRERSLFVAFQLTGGGVIVNFFGTGAALFSLTGPDGAPAIAMAMIVPFVVILVFKVISANMMRGYLALSDWRSKKKEVRS